MKNNENKIFSLSTKEGIFWSIMLGTGEAYITPFVIASGAPSFFIGLLNSIPLFIGSIFQSFSLHIFNLLGERKNIILFSIFIQALIWLLFSLYSLSSPLSFNIILFLFTAYFIFGMLPGPLWNSWIADLISKKNVGNFFATRSQYLLFFQFFSILSAGFLLKFIFEKNIFYGFSFLFFVAFLSRLISLYFMHKIPDTKFFFNGHRQHLNWRKFILNKKFSHYKNFSLFTLILILGTYISAPFFDVYMLKVLNFGYLTWSIILFGTGFSKVFVFKYWAHAIKLFGHKPVLISIILAISLFPIFWLFTKEPFFLFLVSIFGSIAWAGWDVISFLYLLSPKSKEIKILYSSFFQLVRGFGIVLGSLIGGFILSFFEQIFDLFVSFYLIFILSGIIRFLSIVFFTKKLDKIPLSKYTFLLKKLFFSYPLKWFGQNMHNFLEPILHFTKFFKYKKFPFNYLLKEI